MSPFWSSSGGGSQSISTEVGVSSELLMFRGASLGTEEAREWHGLTVMSIIMMNTDRKKLHV